MRVGRGPGRALVPGLVSPVVPPTRRGVTEETGVTRPGPMGESGLRRRPTVLP